MSKGRIAPVESRHDICRDYPTPLAWLFQQAFQNFKDRQLWMTYLFGETLRFLALLALQDSLAYGLFGAGNKSPEKTLEILKGKISLGNWLSLLRQACPITGTSLRFIPELAGWTEGKETRPLLEALLNGRNDLAHGYPPQDFSFKDRAGEYGEMLQMLYARLSFLKHYLLVVVLNQPDSDSSTVLVQVLRNANPKMEPLELEIDDASPFPIKAGELCLLDPKKQLALRLYPAFRWVTFDAGPEVCGIHFFEVAHRKDQAAKRGQDAAEGETPAEVRKAFLDSFTSERVCLLLDAAWHRRVKGSEEESQDDLLKITRKLPLTDMMGKWLGPDTLHKVFQINWDGTSSAHTNVGRFLSEESWEQIEKLVSPSDEVEMVGGRYRVQTAIHAGEHVDIFLAVEEGRAEVGSLVVHVLKQEAGKDKEVRSWFKNRLDCWKSTEHPNVLRPFAGSDPESEQPRPFLATDFKADGRNLHDVVRREGALSRERLVSTMRLAAQVCSVAHREGIRLVTLPPRHFLLDKYDVLWVTGFDTAVRVGVAAPSKDYWQRFTRDWNYIAPEALDSYAQLNESVDVFALGVLLEWLQQKAGLPVQSLAESHRADAWDCLAYHCLAADPNLRFQSAEHFLSFLDGWVVREDAYVPQTLEVPEGRLAGQSDGGPVPRFHAGKYPVTNYEYERFCRETGHPFPLPYRKEKRRLTGPLCPVVGASLKDAQVYCEWLEKKTGRRWRLPNEREWMRAAALDHPRQYPWDDQAQSNNRRAKASRKGSKKQRRGKVAGPNRPYAGPASHLANYDRFYNGPTVVGAFPAGRSASGCFDMAGNVWEWCFDFISPDDPHRVLKGGAYYFSFDDLQVRARRGALLNCLSPHIGFRVVFEE